MPPRYDVARLQGLFMKQCLLMIVLALQRRKTCAETDGEEGFVEVQVQRDLYSLSDNILVFTATAIYG